MKRGRAYHYKIYTYILSAILLSWYMEVFAFRYLAIGDHVPPLTLEAVQGGSRTISFIGKVTVVIFWRPGQNFSLQALNDLEKIFQVWKGKGVEILAIAAKTSRPEAIRAVMEQNRFSYPFFLDKDGKAAEHYGIIVHPSTGVIDQGGQLIYYQPSHHRNYQAIIEGHLQVLFGMISQEELEQKLTRLGESVGEASKKAQALYKEALTLEKSQQPEKAIQLLTQAITLAPSLLDAHVHLGYLLIDRGDLKQALEEFTYVLERNPRSPAARTGLGIAYARLGEKEKALTLLQEAININPDPVRAYAELGKIYEESGDYDHALYYYKWAIRKLQQGRR